MEQLKNYLNETKKRSFLDIGTGGGNFIHFLKELYNDFDIMVGIDTFERGIDAARKNFDDKRIAFEVMDGYNTIYDDNTFDVISFSNSLHHITDVKGLFKEIKRILKDDGFVIINEMMADNLDKMQESHKMLHHFAAKLDRLHGDTHLETYTEEEIKDHLVASGDFKIHDTWHLDVPRRTENSQEELDHILGMLDRVSNRIPEENKEDLLKEKEAIKQYIVANGYDGCTSFIGILNKA